MGRDDEIQARLRAMFQAEAGEHLDALREGFGELAREPERSRAAELVEESFRAIHTLKGAARSVGRRDIERRCQECESVLSALKRERAVPDDGTLARLRQATEDIERLLHGAPAPSRPVAPPRHQETIRLDAAKLDSLLLEGEDLLALKLAAAARANEADELVAELSALHRDAGRDDAGLRAVEARARALHARLETDRRATASGVDGLVQAAWHARMMPVATVLDLFPQMVRDLAHSAGKEVDWGTAGGAELEVDRRILETLKDPLIHLVRNAVGHGIEPPGERETAGKPRRGRVTASVATTASRRIRIVVEDDGGGIDVGRVREAAVRSRLVDAPAAAQLSDESALALLYRSGLSTSHVITDVSGHGLGLAIVKERVERLDGEISIESRPGRGTAVRMTVPVAIAGFHGLLVRAGGQRFLVSIGAVERVVAGSGASVRWQDEALPAADLATLLGLPAAPAGPDAVPACLIVRGAGATAGVLVDEVLGDREVTVKQLEPPLLHVRHVAAAGLLGSGDVALILRPADLVRSVRDGLVAQPPPEAPPTGPPLVLVVDDAITTRAMERSLLEAAGYRVLVAADGVDAWTALQEHPVDLVVSDIDMPRMDGFDLTSRIRADPALAGLPVVLVTALESREDKERGIRLGANAYVVKSSFEESNLLEIIRRLGVRPAAGERA